MSVMQESAPAGRTRRRFTKEFKADAVALVFDGDRSIASVARDLGIGETNLGNWVRQARIDRGEETGFDHRRARRVGVVVRLRRERRAGASRGVVGFGVEPRC